MGVPTSGVRILASRLFSGDEEATETMDKEARSLIDVGVLDGSDEVAHEPVRQSENGVPGISW